ncbi:ATP synthase F1 subunit delta [Oscillospiraceae bacterium MB08-C2-2]|nr:ATP synthase F1 subunit delta [Oscillospiraceae bacterium MB08-C2-2]
MLALTGRYALALMHYAEENGLELVYCQALDYILSINAGHPSLPDAETALGRFLEHVPEEEVDAVLYRFLDMARKRMDIITVEVFSAVPLTQEQLCALEQEFIHAYRKQVDITATVDPSLIGGLRVIVDDKVIDATIKRQLEDMKRSIYKGVYFKQ